MPGLYQIAVLLTVAVGSFTVGFSVASAANVIGLPGFLEYFGISLTGSNPSYSASMQGAIVGGWYAGGAIGALCTGWVADNIGRRKTLQGLALVALVASILQTAAVHVSMMLLGRVLVGAAAGGLKVVCPTYQAEVSRADNRGRAVGLHGTFFVGGISAALFIGFGCYYITNPQVQWRLVFGCQCLFPIILTLATLWLPESPRWLVANGREEDAYQLLCRLHSGPEDLDNLVASEELAAIRAQLSADGEHDSTFIQLFRRPATRKRIIIACVFVALGQSTGINVVYSFMVNLLPTLGVVGSIPLLINAIYNTVASGMNYVGAIALDKYGRKPMIITGFTGAAIALSIHTALVVAFEGANNKAANGLAIFFIFLYVTFFAAGVDVTTFVYPAEIFPTHMRARGMSLAMAVYMASACVWVTTSPSATTAIGAKYNIVFIGFSVCGALVVHFFFPETRGLSLEEMGQIFGDYVPDEAELVHQHQLAAGAIEEAAFDAEKKPASVQVSSV